MLRIEIASAADWSSNVSMFEADLRREILKLAARFSEKRNVRVNRVQFTKPKPKR